MKNVFHIILLLTIISSCNHCKEIPEPLIEPLEWKGVKCKIDGKGWESCSAGIYPANTFDIYKGQYFVISATSWCKSDTFISINIMIKSRQFDTGVFVLNDYDKGSVVLRDKNDWLFETNNFHIGKLYISEIDKIKETLSGSFEFNAIDTTGKRTMNFTNGLMKNIHYNQY